MGNVSAYLPAGAVPAAEYLGAVRPVGMASVGGAAIQPFVEPGRMAHQEDPEEPDWVQEEYGGQFEGIERADVSAETVVTDESDVDPLEGADLGSAIAFVAAPTVAKRGPGRPRKDGSPAQRKVKVKG